MELEAKGSEPNRSWTPVVPVPEETIAVAMFQWKRVPITRGLIVRMLAYGLIIILVCTGFAYAASATSPAVYGARSEIIYPIDVSTGAGGVIRQDIHLATQLVQLKSRQLLQPVALKNHLSIDALTKKVSASIVANRTVIRVQVNDHSPTTAKEMAGEIVLEYMRTQPNDDLQKQTSLKTAINEATTQIASYTDQLRGLPSTTSPQAVALQSQLQSALDNRNSLQSAYDQAAADAAGKDHVQILTPAYVLAGKVAPKPIQAGIAGFLLGLMLAAGVIVLMVRRMLKKLPLDPNG